MWWLINIILGVAAIMFILYITGWLFLWIFYPLKLLCVVVELILTAIGLRKDTTTKADGEAIPATTKETPKVSHSDHLERPKHHYLYDRYPILKPLVIGIAVLNMFVFIVIWLCA